MLPIVILASLVALPILVAFMFRVHVVFLMLSILIGDLLVRFLSDDVAFAISAFVPSANVPLMSQVLVLTTPILITMFVLRKTVPASKALLHLLPIISSGLLFAVLALPILPSPLQQEIFATAPGDLLRQSQDVIVGVSCLLVLLVLYQSFYKRPDKSAKHGK